MNRVERRRIYCCIGAAAVVLAAYTVPLHAAPFRFPGRCIGQLPQTTLSGRLGAHEEAQVFTWKTTCTGPFSSSSTGLVMVSIQQFEKGKWRSIAQGYAPHIPRLGPGSYRIVVKNDLPRPTNYTVRHSRGLG
ncbi:hypothetical protein [Xanthomonas sp. NCPPB 2632]|jgi:hypothetical protein|uniref:hypothetical protein n=1 Tax=Xanthomonas sp. NCPPB 2632 TaxID=3240912 RepID=UPI003519C4B4